MKHEKSLCMLLLALGIGALEAHSQSLIVQLTDGTETTALLSSMQNFTLPDSSLVLKETSGTTTTFSLSSVRRIYFKDVASLAPAETTTTVAANVGKTALSFYPNPVGQEIFFNNLSGNSVAKIYRMDGVMVQSSVVTPESNTMNVGGLGKGLYILSVNNTTFKFNKL